ncbi:MAG: C-GCAxxG-C-C family protein [Candidatus Cloacimonetes bacterium]|nr:C-GCAxxG-C-C family protein [Candidatus Cloacimonadota bacterium]
MNRRKEALKTYEKGFNCSQSVLSAFKEEISLDKNLLLKIAAGFGGGMRKGEVCGAVSGAIMVLGLKYGNSIEGDVETKEHIYSLTREFMKRFEEKNGSVVCKQLLGYDLSNPEEHEILKKNDTFKQKCPFFIEDAVDILEEILFRETH